MKTEDKGYPNFQKQAVIKDEQDAQARYDKTSHNLVPAPKDEPAVTNIPEEVERMVTGENAKCLGILAEACVKADLEPTGKAARKAFWQHMKDRMWGDIHAPE